MADGNSYSILDGTKGSILKHHEIQSSSYADCKTYFNNVFDV
jgi:hypothetical protein